MAAVLIAACSEPEPESPSWWLDGAADASVIELPAEGTVAFAPEGGRRFVLDRVGQITQARAWGDTIVGVIDIAACEAVLVSVAGEDVEWLQRFGRCGDGPGEFRAPTDLLLDGDTLIVVDGDHGRFTFLPLDGSAVRDIQLTQVAGDPWIPLEIVAADAETIVVTASLPGAGVSADAGFLRTIRRDDASLVRAAVPDPPLAGTNPAQSPRRISACHDPQTDRIVVANRWRVERLVLDRSSQTTVRRLISTLPWFETAEPFGDQGGVVPAGFVRLVCGDGQALIVWRGRPRTPNSDRYVMELIALDGAEHRIEHGLLEEAHPARFGLAGRSRDGWVFYTNSDPAGPVLLVRDLEEGR